MYTQISWFDDFNGDGNAYVLFYYPGDDNCWLDTYDNTRSDGDEIKLIRVSIFGLNAPLLMRAGYEDYSIQPSLVTITCDT